MVALKVALALLAATAEAARVNAANKQVLGSDVIHDLDTAEMLSVESADEFMANMTSQIGYTLGRLDFENEDALDVDAPVRSWPKELDSDYKLERKLACGFHGCAFLARDKDGDEVVVKVSSSGDGNQGAGAEECGRARYIHYTACGKGEAATKAAQSYLPGCDGYGTLKNGAGYLVLPMAGGTDFNKFKASLKKNPLSVAEQKSIFAQLVAGIYGMHKVGVTHNDMHGKNVLINDQKQVAILDYGLGTAYPCPKNRRARNGYARDANMLYAYTAMITNCGRKNQWPGVWIGLVTDKSSYRRKTTRCMEAIKEQWGTDKEFEDAVQKVWAANIQSEENQHIEELFNTRFVQQNLPASTTRFQMDGMDQCYKWDKDTLKRKAQEAGVVPFICK